MKYLKLFEDFNQSLIDQLVSDTKMTAEKNGVKIIFEQTKTIPYFVGGSPVSGYFIDYGTPTLAVAMGKPVDEWVMVLAHESSHMDQWIEKSSYWTNSFIDGREAVDHIDEWCVGRDLTEEELDNAVNRARGVELDCERRTIVKAKEFQLPINVDEEIQKANSYILFYTMIKYTRKWNKPGQAPYQIKEVWSRMPITFNMDYDNIPDDIKELYMKYCF